LLDSANSIISTLTNLAQKFSHFGMWNHWRYNLYVNYYYFCLTVCVCFLDHVCP